MTDSIVGRRDFRSFGRTLQEMTDAERFWLKVERSDGCWIWLGCLNGAGYGMVGVLAGCRRTTRSASRMAYELTYGPIPDARLFVCHHCDNPPCVRPDHLFLGTAADNTHDAQRKGRIPTNPPVLKGRCQGERHAFAKATCEMVLSIRDDYAAGRGSLSQLALKYGLHFTTISKIVNRKNWKHVPERTTESAA